MTRAQEAEENYVIKRELAVVRQQCTTASESLEKAQDTIRELQQQRVNLGPESVHEPLTHVERRIMISTQNIGTSVMYPPLTNAEFIVYNFNFNASGCDFSLR